MNCYNNVNLIGRICSEITETAVASGKLKLSFSIAVSRGYTNSDGERDSDFIRCEVWGPTAIFIHKYFSKGDPICINGELRNNNYIDKNGVKRYTFFVNVTTAQFTVQNHSKKNNNEQMSEVVPYQELDIPPMPEEYADFDGEAF